MKKLSSNELLALLGGAAITREEYCETLDMIISNNWDNMTQGEKDGAMHGWNKHCAKS
jgi:hypothetical protein